MRSLRTFDTHVPGRNTVRPIAFKAHKIDGFSPESLERHYEHHYGGAVRRLNEIELKLAARPPDDSSGRETMSLKDEELDAANEVILHELHFDGLGEEGGAPLAEPRLVQAIDASFGSFSAWRSEFASMAESSTNDTGWIVLAWCERLGRLLNIACSDTSRALSGARPLLGLDLSEHAYRSDFGTDRSRYVEAYLRSIHWGRVGSRFVPSEGVADEARDGEETDQITVDELKGLLDRDGDEVIVLDVRHDDDRERYRRRIARTDWRDSFDVPGWARELPGNKKLVVYCMYGFWVSRKVAGELRAEGFDARSLAGGIVAWRAMGYPSSDTVDDRSIA